MIIISNTIYSYIQKLKKEIPGDLNEIETARYLYISLGKLMSFDEKYVISNKEEKRKIYSAGIGIESLDVLFQGREIVCKSLAYILEKIGREFDLEVVTTVPKDIDYDPHVYNVLKLRDEQKIEMDLQRDLDNIQTNCTTEHFKFEDEKVNTQNEQKEYLKQIDMKIGYIGENRDYSDHYFYLMEMALENSNIPLYKKIEFACKYANTYNDNRNIKMIQGIHYHKAYLNKVLTPKEAKRIEWAICYRQEDKKAFSILSFDTYSNKTCTLIYNEKQGKYVPIQMEEIYRMYQDDMKIKIGSIAGLKRYTRSKRQEDRIEEL